MNREPFIRYLVKGHYDYKRWHRWVAPILEHRGWSIIDPKVFPHDRLAMPDKAKHSLKNATVVLEFRGQPDFDSVFYPGQNRTVVDDLLAYLRLYTGVFCDYLWREWCIVGGSAHGALATVFHSYKQRAIFVTNENKVADSFERVLPAVPTLDKTRLMLAMSWFVSGLREYTPVGRPLVEAALNWVCLESQANHLYPHITGKDAKFKRVARLLEDQGFPPVPRLHNLYLLRNDAFHDGRLSNLGAMEAQVALTTGRALVRAQILNMLGVSHADFRQEFVDIYAN